MSVERPAHLDLDRLRAAYEEADGDIPTVAAQFPASISAVRKVLIRNGIHEPADYTSYVTLLEEMSVEEFDRRLAEANGDES